MEKFEWMPKFGRFIVKLCLVFTLGTGMIGTCNTSAQSEILGPVEKAIIHLVKGVPSNPAFRAKFRKKFVPNIEESATEHDIDPLVLVVVLFKESSFRKGVTNSKGERGLGQQHGLAAKGCDFSTQRGQIDCTSRWIKKSIDKCETLEGAFSMYISGGCRPRSAGITRGARKRVKLLNELKELK